MHKQIDPVKAAKIDAIDLTNAKKRLMDPKSGKGWSQAKVDEVEKKYKNFLKLISTGMTCTPSLEVDYLWHEHILHTRAYRTMSNDIFGYYVDHNPETNDDDQKQNKQNWETTQKAYKKLFGEPLSSKG